MRMMRTAPENPEGAPSRCQRPDRAAALGAGGASRCCARPGGESVAVSALVWYEFLSGPLAETEAGLARAFIEGRILPVGEDAAELAAELFNAAGRKRTLKTDAHIAAMAIRAKAEFVTLNGADFEPFVSQGLRLFPLPA